MLARPLKSTPSDVSRRLSSAMVIRSSSASVGGGGRGLPLASVLPPGASLTLLERSPNMMAWPSHSDRRPDRRSCAAAAARRRRRSGRRAVTLGARAPALEELGERARRPRRLVRLDRMPADGAGIVLLEPLCDARVVIHVLARHLGGALG